jgi:ABC-type glycerol-3-phosphate transport system permease component
LAETNKGIMAIKRSLPKDHKLPLTIVFILFCIYSASLLYPIIWVFIQSLRSKLEFFWAPLELPQKIIFDNYLRIFTTYNVFEMFFNSTILTFGGVFASTISSATAAYVVSRYNFKARNLLYSIIIVTMIIPTTGSMAATYRLMNDLKFAGNRWGLIVMGSGGFGFSFFLLYGYFKNISYTYADSAKIDGAGHFRIFLSIMLPIALPALMAVGIVSFIGAWNDYFTPYMYLREKPTLAVGIYLLTSDITNGANAYDYPALFAIMVISIVPVVTIYSIFQKTIVTNTVAGGIKG